MAGSWHATAGLGQTFRSRQRQSPQPGREPQTEHPEAFIPPGSPYLGQAVPGNRICQSDVLSRTGDYRDETSIRCGHACAPRPSLFSDSGGLAQNLVEAFLDVRDETERRAAPLSPGRSADPVDAGRQPGEMAPRPYHLVLRAIPARRALPGLPALPPRLRLSVQFLLRQRRTASRPPPARPSDPPERRRDHRLSPPRRCRRGEIFPDRRRGRAGETAAAGGSRPQSRAAASGIDADRHPARLRAKPDPARLRSGTGAFPRPRADGDPWVSAQRGHPHHRARRRQLSFRQRKARPSRAGRARSSSRATSSPMPSGWRSWTTAATRRRRSG